MLEIHGLYAGYPGRPVLQDMNLAIPAGKVTAILGPNGCGKSTLLKTICGILPAQRGRVTLRGQDLVKLERNARARCVAYLSQNRQVPDITVRRLVLHGRFPYLSYPRRYRPEDLAAAEKAMARMGILDLAEEPLNQLSGGQRQKVYIAMALAQETDVILLDEPTTYLDIRHQLGMLRQAKDLAAGGKTVIMVVHDIPQALHTADQVILMEAGRVAAAGTPEEIVASGQLQKVFGVKLNRVSTEQGWQYYCGEA